MFLTKWAISDMVKVLSCRLPHQCRSCNSRLSGYRSCSWEAAVRLDNKSWFADVGLSTSDSIWDLLSFFPFRILEMLCFECDCEAQP